MIPPIADRFVAGESIAAALDHTRALNESDVKVILNLLGEHYDNRQEADADAETYRKLIDEIAATELDGCVSVKPSQIGLDIGDEVFAENYERIVAHAAEKDVFVWCDMEDAETTDITLDVFESMAETYPWQVGQCIQSNLKRTADDLERLVDVPGKIRVVKGAYDEDRSIAYKKKSKVNERYREDISFLFEHRDRGIAIGSHDPEMIDHARSLADEYDATYEIQMLMGVREDAQRSLASEGVEVWQYAPYGEKWFSYFYRRVRERKENALFAVRAILGR